MIAKLPGVKDFVESEAMAQLEEPRLRLRIAGQGPMVPAIEEAARHDPRIEYLGFLTFDEIIEVYRRADLLLNLRLTRTIRTKYFFPSKVIEFLASGTPLLTTCPGHVRTEFGDVSYLLEDETPRALAQQLRAILDIPREERLERAMKGKKQILRTHSWKAQGKKVANFIRRRLAGDG